MSTSSESSIPSGNEIRAGLPEPIMATLVPTGQLSAEDLIILNEEIAALAKAGLPLDQGLAVLGKQMAAGRLKSVTAQLADDLRVGHTLPQALERQKGRVPSYYAALLAAGVRSGRLGDVLATLTIYSRAMADFRSNLVSALLYPLIVFIMGFSLIVLLSFYVLPIYVQIFAEFRMKLPLMTEILVFVSRHPFQILILPPLVLITAVLVQRFWLRRTPEGRMTWARIVYSLPIFGYMLRAARLAGFTDLLGILVDQKVPLPEALSLAAETSSDPLLMEGGRLLERDIRQGVPLGPALKNQRLMPELVIWMVGLGERQGNLGAALHQVAEMYRRQAEMRAAFLRVVLPPILIIFVGMFFFFVFVFGINLPFLELLDGLSGGGKK
jgi:type II secretory pathway component PulF